MESMRTCGVSNSNGLFTRGRDLNHEITLLQHEKNDIKEHELTACRLKYKKIRNYGFNKLICSHIFESQRVDKRRCGPLVKQTSC